MNRIDAHQHFWHYDASKQTWIDNNMMALKKDFLPPQFLSHLKENDINGSVVVQADASEEETNFLLKMADAHSFIKGVVGWVDICSSNLEERLKYYKKFALLKGFRMILQIEEPAYLLQSSFIKGISLLQQYGFTFDLLIFPKHLKAAKEIVSMFPDQRFVIDHLAKPNIKEELIKEWEKDIENIAAYKNVYCKVSGMVTEAASGKWKDDTFIPYLNVVTSCFGTNRIMFGSDWPVCLLEASYEQTISIIKKYYATYSLREQENIFGLNAINFYQLK